MYHRSEIWLKRVFVLFPALVLLFGFLPAVLAAATSGNLEITADTTLTADHDGQIEITADNVTLDCDGHSVTWTGETEWFGIGILEERSGVTVKNCEVSGDDGFGIISFFGSDHMVLNNVVHGNRKGISFHQSHDNQAIGNQVYDNDESGIATFFGDRNFFSSNEVCGNGSGISVTGSEGSTIEFNVARGNAAQGIGVWRSGGRINDLRSRGGPVDPDGDGGRRILHVARPVHRRWSPSRSNLHWDSGVVLGLENPNPVPLLGGEFGEQPLVGLGDDLAGLSRSSIGERVSRPYPPFLETSENLGLFRI